MKIQVLDPDQESHWLAWLDLLDEYAASPEGGGKALEEDVRRALPERLRQWPRPLLALAWRGDEAVGLLNAFEAFSTFRARPILNIHDLAVSASAQGQGIGRALLDYAEDEARRRGCCKLSLEVLAGNERAKALYRRLGFSAYELDARFGAAQFWEKVLD